MTDSDEGRAEAQQLTTELRQWWAEGFPSVEQQQTLMDTTRSAIAQQLVDHLA